MAMTFDATLKDMGRDSPQGFLAAFDRPATLPVKLLNVDLSTVTTAADLILGLGDPVAEIVHLDFQSSAAAWKHADDLGVAPLAMLGRLPDELSLEDGLTSVAQRLVERLKKE